MTRPCDWEWGKLMSLLMQGNTITASLDLFLLKRIGHLLPKRSVHMFIIVIMRLLMELSFRGFCKVWILMFLWFVICRVISFQGRWMSVDLQLYTYPSPPL